MNNNPPYAVVELSKEQYDFILRNCDSNIRAGLSILTTTGKTSEPMEVKIVELIEQFKNIKKVVEKSKL